MDALTTPLNWQKVRLGDICEIGNGGAYETLIVENGDFKLISLNSIDIDGNLKNTMKRVNFYDNSLKQDDIVMVLSDVAHGDFLELCAVIPSNDYVLNQRMGRLRKRNDCINILFLRLYINANQKYFKMQGQGSSQLNLSKKAIEDFEILLPPLNEQIAIANILSGVDHYLYSLDALILKKESVKKALSFELLSQRKRLKGFNQNWQRVRLGTYKYRRGSFPQPYGNPQWYSDNGMPFVQVYDVGENFKLTQKTKQKISKIAQPMSVFVPKNSVIITLQGTIGRVALTQYDCYCDRTILIFDNNTLNDVNKYFFVLSLFTKFEEEKRKADGSIIKTITKQTLKDFEILLPPLNEQIAIANILSDLDSEITSLKNKKRQFENIKKALNHDLMSAKIRVLKK